MRTHPLRDDQKEFGIFDKVTASAVFPIQIIDGIMKRETFTFKGQNRVAETDHKLNDMIHSMNYKGTVIKHSDGETTTLDCGGIFKSPPFEFIQKLQDFTGIVKVNFNSGNIFLFEKVKDAISFEWSTEIKDSFKFKSDGRHPQSSHKIFSEIFKRSGFMFSEIFGHESCIHLVVENMSEGIIGDLIMKPFVGEKGNRHLRAIKMIEDAGSYIFPYIWGNQPMLKINMGIDYKYLSTQFICPLLETLTKENFEEEITNPVILRMSRGRGRNHTDNVTFNITHQLVETISH